ncbi:MAG: helix-turn-helix transcriptional regulator [Clostridia bacterium]|nr:helix-turn-helix transcriptional regulator [Clostridia bacterium]
MKLSENIRNHRIKEGLTQEQLARMLSVSTQTVSKWERDLVLPDVLIMSRLALLFHTTTDALLGTDEQRCRSVEKKVRQKSAQLCRKGKKEEAWTLLYESVCQNPAAYGLCVTLLQLTYHERLCSAERVGKLFTPMALLEQACTKYSLVMAARRYMIRICAACNEESIRARVGEYYQKLPSLRDARESYARYVMQGEKLQKQAARTTYTAMSIAEAAYRDILPDDAPPKLRLMRCRASVTLWRTVLGEDYAGYYESELCRAYLLLARQQRLMGLDTEAAESMTHFFTLVRRQLRYVSEPCSVPLSPWIDTPDPPQYPSALHMSCHMMAELLLDESGVYAPYRRTLRELYDRCGALCKD